SSCGSPPDRFRTNPTARFGSSARDAAIPAAGGRDISPGQGSGLAQEVPAGLKPSGRA
ncbi:hypothetical protein G3I60_43680, partial [Streptomyces sp. SID13666]|nr:hypothetical protein [Streptomyces sp. SID13666]